jgi:hypothetical protein
MSNPPDPMQQDEVRRRLEAARTRLAARMAAAGFTEQKGWRLLEELRSTSHGTQFVLRPCHVKLGFPDGMEETVRIDSEGRLLD